jgi:hypothetical protein
MSRDINKLSVCETSLFEGLATFNSDIQLNTANLVMNTGTGSITVNPSTQTANRVAYFPDNMATDSTFVFTTLAQTLTNKTLTGATISGSNISTSTMTSSTISSSIITGATISTSLLLAPKVDKLLDTNGNIALNIVAQSGSNNTSWQSLQISGTSGNLVTLQAVGQSSNIDIKISPKGTGRVTLRSLTFPSGVGNSGDILVADGLGSLSFQFSETPLTFTLQTSTSSTIATHVIGLPTNNQTSYITVKGVATTTNLSDSEGGAFDLRTAYMRVTANSSIRKIGNPTCEDLLSYTDNNTYTIYSQPNTSSGEIVLFVTSGTSTATVSWTLNYVSTTA